MVSRTNVNSQTIEVNGICADPQSVSVIISEFPYWYQNIVNQILTIPIENPDIETINSINISVEVLRQQIIKTPIASVENIENKTLSGRKLIIEGQFCEKILYTADLDDQPIFSITYYVPFSSYIVVPKEFSFNGTIVDSLDVNYSVDACIEDLSISLMGSRVISNQVTFLLYAVPQQ